MCGFRVCGFGLLEIILGFGNFRAGGGAAGGKIRRPQEEVVLLGFL